MRQKSTKFEIHFAIGVRVMFTVTLYWQKIGEISDLENSGTVDIPPAFLVPSTH